MQVKVLDSWALLGWLQGEIPVHQLVRRLFARAEKGTLNLAISWINLGEVFYVLARKAGHSRAENFLSEVPNMPIRSVLPDRQTIVQAALWKSRFSISYADAFAVQTAVEHRARLVTGDPELRQLEAAQVLKLDWVSN